MTRGQRIHIKPMDDLCDLKEITMDELRVLLAEVDRCLPEEVDIDSWTHEAEEK